MPDPTYAILLGWLAAYQDASQELTEAYKEAEQDDSQPEDKVFHRRDDAAVALADAIAPHLRQLIGYKIEYELLKRQLATPPPGWYVLGHHMDQPNVGLEFWGDEGGVPMWERPADEERMRELHHFETEQENARLQAENAQLRRLLPPLVNKILDENKETPQ